jgi:hypothetical protein
MPDLLIARLANRPIQWIAERKLTGPSFSVANRFGAVQYILHPHTISQKEFWYNRYCRLATWALDICLLSAPLLYFAPLHRLHFSLYSLRATSVSSYCILCAPLHCLHLALRSLLATSLFSPCTALPERHFTLNCTPYAPLHCFNLALHSLRSTSPCTALPALHFTLYCPPSAPLHSLHLALHSLSDTSLSTSLLASLAQLHRFFAREDCMPRVSLWPDWTQLYNLRELQTSASSFFLIFLAASTQT